jgi:uncharacterized lipoprotein YmbA
MKSITGIASLMMVALLASCSSARSSNEVGMIPHARYDEDIKVVFLASQDACMDYFKRVDRIDDKNYTIYVNNNNFWAGDTDVNISLVTEGE